MKNTNLWKKNINVQTITSDYVATIEDHSFEIDTTNNDVTLTLPDNTKTTIGKEYIITWIAGGHDAIISTGSATFKLNDFESNRVSSYTMENIDDTLLVWLGSIKWNLK